MRRTFIKMRKIWLFLEELFRTSNTLMYSKSRIMKNTSLERDLARVRKSGTAVKKKR